MEEEDDMESELYSDIFEGIDNDLNLEADSSRKSAFFGDN